MKRYRHYQGALREHPDGNWVKWEDVQAIVDQLPKCWRLVGGKLVKDVSVTPGMITYCDDAQPLAHQWDMRLGSGETFADHCRRNHERHCDSREAAEATGDE